MNVAIVSPMGQGMIHHHARSGYQALLHYLDAYCDIQLFAARMNGFGEQVWRAVRKPLHVMRLVPHGYERGVESRGLRAQADVVHHLYADFTYLRAPSNKTTVGTLHVPPAQNLKWLPFDWVRRYKRLASVVSLGENLTKWLREYGIPTTEIPHGVDTEEFTPPAGGRDETHTCLMTGGFHRDFDTLARAVPLVKAAVPDAEFRLVIPRMYYRRNRKAIAAMAKDPNVRILSGISDETLTEEYRRADVYLAPMRESVANNGLLEAMSTGLPIVASDVGGVRSYLTEGFVAPFSPSALAQATIHLLTDRPRARAIGNRMRQRAVAQFDWRVVAKMHAQMYAAVLAS